MAPKKSIDYNYTVNYFKNLGYPEHVAKGIAGNVGWESNFDPAARNKESNMQGLAQWDKKRRAGLYAFAKGNNLDYTEPDTQLAYIDHELKTTERTAYNAMASASNVEEAADAFGHHYERYTPKGETPDPAEIAGRRQFALTGIRPNAKTLPTSTSSTSPMATVSTADLSKNANSGVYADQNIKNLDLKQPLFKKKVQTYSLMDGSSVNMTEAAMKQAQASGKYQGARQMRPVEDKMNDMLPYLSNLYSAGLKPPPVPSPMMMSPTSLQRVSMNVDRNKVEGDYRTFANTAQQTLGAAEGTRAMLGAKAQKFEQMSKVNEVERNANIQIANQEREANMAIDQANRKAMYDKQLMDVNRQNAIIAQKSANLANVSDKMLAQQSVKDQRALEQDKFRIMQENDTYGNLNRYLGKESKKQGEIVDPTERAYGGMLKMAKGGRLYTAGRFMRGLKPIKTIM
jgi:hypothetical protein